MRVEVLTVSDCPHGELAKRRLREAIEQSGIEADVIERVIDDAELVESAGMAGSPTILIDGRDSLGLESAQPSLSCRLYRTEAGTDGAPTVTQLIAALTNARTRTG